MNSCGGRASGTVCLLFCVALAACADSQSTSGGPVTAEDWLRADREAMRTRTPTPETEARAQSSETPLSEGGRILPPSEVEAPPMPPLPPPEVEVKGTVPPVTGSIEPPRTETELPPAELLPETGAPPPVQSRSPAPPPLIAAPEPAETKPPAAAAPTETGLIPEEFTQSPEVAIAARFPDPAKLKGFEPAAMQALLGVPDMLRWESHAQVYQYRGTKCILDIIFYESPTGGPFQAAYLSARGPRGQDSEVMACLVDLLPAEAWPETLLN